MNTSFCPPCAVTLACEIAHVVTPDDTVGMARDVHELIAESVASTVGFQFGVDSSLCSATDDRQCGGMQHTVPNYGTSLGELSQRPGFRVGWAQLPGAEEILFFYDRDDDCFGYAWNVTNPLQREWSYAPF